MGKISAYANFYNSLKEVKWSFFGNPPSEKIDNATKMLEELKEVMNSKETISVKDMKYLDKSVNYVTRNTTNILSNCNGQGNKRYNLIMLLGEAGKLKEVAKLSEAAKLREPIFPVKPKSLAL